MKEPYNKVIIIHHLDAFRGLGFTIEKDEEYSILFKGGDCALEISTEKFYEPSLATKFIDSKKNEYSIWVLRKILDINELEKDLSKLKLIKTKYNSNKNHNDEEHSKMVEEYLNLSISQLIGFLQRFLNLLCSSEDDFRTAYSEKEDLLLNKIGL